MSPPETASTLPPDPSTCEVAGSVEEAHPGLQLLELTVPLGDRRKTPTVRDRLERLSTSVVGDDLLNARRSQVPGAFRALYLDLGRDPDLDPPPYEATLYRRMAAGGFFARGMPEDALLIALIETGVALWAVDADRVDGPLRLVHADPRDAEPGARAEAIAVVDDRGIVADVGREPRATRAVSRRTVRVTLFGVQPPGVTDVHVHEAFWLCASFVRGAGD